MKTALTLVLCGLVIVLGIMGCGESKDQEGQTPVSEAASPSVPTKEVVPVEATTTQGSRVVFPSGDLSWADAVGSFTPGDPAASRSRDPDAALGEPDYQGRDDATDEATYVSIGHGGELILELTDNVLVDGEGPDLAIFEIGPEVEPILVAISENGQNGFIEVGRVEGSTCSLDIAPSVEPGQRFRFIRLTDAKAGKSNGSEWPGADVDAVGAINTMSSLPAETTQ
jgi:OOP family OmpA-OmpF porin